MAVVRFYHPFALILLLWTDVAHADDPQHPPQLYDRPALVVDPGTHVRSDHERLGRSRRTMGGHGVVRQDGENMVAHRRQARTHDPPAGRTWVIGRVDAVAMSSGRRIGRGRRLDARYPGRLPGTDLSVQPRDWFAGEADRGDRQHSQVHEDRTDSRALNRISRTTRALHISGVIWLTVKILAARETSALGRDDD